MALGYGFFIAIFPLHFKGYPESQKKIQFGSLIGLCASASFIGVALVQWDVDLNWHGMFVNMAFGGVALMILFNTLGLIKPSPFPRYLIFLNLGFFCFVLEYLFVLFFGPPYDSPKGLPIHVGSQKLVVIVMIVTFFVYSLQSWKMVICKNRQN